MLEFIHTIIPALDEMLGSISSQRLAIVDGRQSKRQCPLVPGMTENFRAILKYVGISRSQRSLQLRAGPAHAIHDPKRNLEEICPIEVSTESTSG